MIYYIGTVLLIIAAIPQIYRIIKRNSSKDLSITMYVMTLGGTLFLLVRAIEINDYFFFLTEVAIAIMLTITIGLIIKYR